MFGTHPDGSLSRYWERDLPQPEAQRVAEHLLGCARCRSASEPIRRGIRLADSLPGPQAGPPSWAELAPLLQAERRIATEPRAPWWVAIVAAVAAAAFILWTQRPAALLFERSQAASPLVQAAIGSIPAPAPRIDSDDPAAVQQWIATTTGLQVPLARRVPGDGAEVRVLGAAQLGAGVAVSYTIDGRPARLIVAPRRAAGLPEQGRGWKKIFHSQMRDARQSVLTWSLGEQSYAIASELPGRGLRACFICHDDPATRSVIESLHEGPGWLAFM